MRSIDQSLLTNGEGSSTFTDANGENQVYYQKIPQTNWTVAMVMPENEFREPVRLLFYQLAIASVIGLLLLVLSIHFFSKYLAKQLEKANHLSRALSLGDFTATMDLRTEDELGRMATQFNQMTTTLRATLEQVNHSSQQVAVADQVRKLAEESTAAAEKISLIVSVVQQETTAAISAMNQGSQALDEGLQLVRATGLAFEEITGSTGHLFTRTDAVSDDMKKIRQQMDTIISAMDQFSRTAEQTAGDSQSVASAAEEQNASMLEISSAATMLSKMAE